MPAFSAAQLAAIETGAYYSCDLIEMDFTQTILDDQYSGTPLYLCTAFTDLELTTDTGTHNFIGGKNGLLTTPTVSANVDNDKTTVDISLSSQNLLYVATVQNGAFMNTDVRLYKCIFSSDTAESNTALTIIDSPVQMFKGQIKGATYSAGIDEGSVVFNCDHWLFDNTTVNMLSTDPSKYWKWLENKFNPQNNGVAPFNYIPPLDLSPFRPFTGEVRWGQK
jgi:hypothetical protein